MTTRLASAFIEKKPFVRKPNEQRLGRVQWTFCGDIQLKPFAAGEKPVVLLQTPVTGLSKLTPATARELVWALYSAAEVAEILVERNSQCTSNATNP